jgi:hypothetical protein
MSNILLVDSATVNGNNTVLWWIVSGIEYAGTLACAHFCADTVKLDLHSTVHDPLYGGGFTLSQRSPQANAALVRACGLHSSPLGYTINVQSK